MRSMLERLSNLAQTQRLNFVRACKAEAVICITMVVRLVPALQEMYISPKCCEICCSMLANFGAVALVDRLGRKLLTIAADHRLGRTYL